MMVSAEDVVHAVRQNGVNGDVFLELTEEHLKELAPLLGDCVAPTKIHSFVDPYFTKKQVHT